MVEQRLVKVEYGTTTLGRGRVSVDGLDVSDHTHEIVVRAQAGQPAEVTLTLGPTALDTVVDGLVTAGVIVEYIPTSRSQVAEWIRSLNPADLQQRALNRSDVASGPAAAVTAVLRTLADLIEEGETDG